MNVNGASIPTQATDPNRLPMLSQPGLRPNPMLYSRAIVGSLGSLNGLSCIAVIHAETPANNRSLLPDLAVPLARNRSANVLMVDASLCLPRLQYSLDLPQSPGLWETLSDPTLDWYRTIHAVDVRLNAIHCGAVEHDDCGPLGSARFDKLVQWFKQEFTHTLVELPPASMFAALPAVASRFDGVIIALTCGKTRWEVAQNLKKNLDDAGAKTVGVIMDQRTFHIPKWLYHFV